MKLAKEREIKQKTRKTEWNKRRDEIANLHWIYRKI